MLGFWRKEEQIIASLADDFGRRHYRCGEIGVEATHQEDTFILPQPSGDPT
jgi:hypothetical protein